jgi:hypothetical protein
MRIARLVAGFRDDALCPTHMLDFEMQLKQLLDKIGRLIVQWRLNRLEAVSRADMPPLLFWERDAYRPKRLSPLRNLNCLFGPIHVSRWLYESLDDLGLPALFPLERHLGIVAGVATPALADWVARLSVDFTQRQVLETLRQQQHVLWGAGTLRSVTKAMAEGIAPFQHTVRVQMLLGWLTQAGEAGLCVLRWLWDATA